MTTLDASTLHVEVRRTDEEVEITLRGELDISTAPELWARLDELGAPGLRVALELADLDFVDSTGISCLFRLHQRASDRGGVVVARHASPQLRRLLEITQLNRLIAVVD